MSALERVAGELLRWRKDPIAFVRENFQVEPDEWQKDGLRAFASEAENKKRISYQACAGPGKSALLAWQGLNFLTCYGERGEHPKGAAVSVTSENLQDNLWPEFEKWRRRSPFLTAALDWNRKRICLREHPKTWFISARSWPKTASAEAQGKTLSGLHSKYVLALIDESGDIPVSVLKAAEQALSNCSFGKILQAGNPLSRDGMLFAASSTLRHQWHVIRITGDPDDKKRSPRISKDWAKQQIDTYGRDNPWVMSYILGKFPPASINQLIDVDMINAALGRHLDEAEYGYSQKRLGVDVARFGNDSTELAPRQGLAAFVIVTMRNARGPEIAARVALARERWSWENCYFDDTGGWASSAEDALHQARIPYIPVNFGGKADDPRYFNKRSEMWFRMSHWLKRGGCLPEDPQIARELAAPTYTFQNGKFRLEEKEQIKERLGFSPNKADALALTFAHAEAPQRNKYRHPAIREERVTDWDPLDPSRA